MRWDYDDEYRDEFGKGVHRDILIVPHATNVIKVKGGPPDITSKIPVFAANGQPTNEFQDVEWVITNDDIVKEKFKYSYSLNPNDNITFSSASSAMVQFTIRNKKEYNEDTNRWELEIPNLQYYSFVDENNNVIMGELEGNYIIKVYEYFNGDSDTLIYLGMFRVEEDKAVDNGYNRQITAYDFMMTFREMDIFNWYKHLFTGINKLDNDYVDATNKSGKETKKPDNYDDDVNWVRKKKSKWTVKDALQDLIDNLAAYDMIVYDDSGNAMVGMTNTNPTLYGRDYGEGVGYSGLGMPIMLDPELFDTTAEYSIPTEPGEDQFEHYGYMKISELEFMEDPSIMKSESLSMGKFLEDIGVLAGRYPYIRTDYLEDDDYHDPSSYAKGKNRYNNYEKCILTFKPLPSSKDDKTSSGTTKLQPEQTFSNHEIVKGFQHELFTVKDVMIVKIYFRDGNNLEFKKLTKSQRNDDKKKALQTFSFSDNMFCSYLVDESDDEEIKKLIPEYQKIKDKLFGKQKKNGNMSDDALFAPGYYNIKYRNYVPYKLTTYCDPVRDVGDRIQINFEDKVTGELSSFYTYILSRDIEGIQKQMDTYSANGQSSNPVFSNYQTSSRYESSIGNNIQLLGYKKLSDANSGGGLAAGYVTSSDLVGYLRNVGIRLLDEPLKASAKFLRGGDVTASYVRAYNHNGSWDNIMPTEGDTETHGLMWCDSADGTKKWNEIEKSEPYECFDGYNGYESDFFIYASNGTWVHHIDDSLVNRSNGDQYDFENLHYMFPVSIKPTTLAPGDTTNLITVNGKEIEVEIGDCLLFKNTSYDDDYFNYVTGLDNFIVNKTGPSGRHNRYEWNNFAWYIAPGVWSTTSGANDPEHRVLQSNSSGDTTHGRIIFDDDFDAARWYVPKYCIYPEDLKPGDTTKNIILNDVPITAEYSTSIDINSEGAADGVYYCDTNYSKNNDWTSTTMTYVYPGIWVDVGEINVRSLNDYAASSPTKKHVELKWKDPSDITTYEPTPAEWKGTIVIRKEDTPPKHRWDGVEIVRTNSENKDAYENSPYRDESIKLGKVYYYGFFPYYKAREQDEHNINFFRFTKVIEVDTRINVKVPTILLVTFDQTDAAIDYALPTLEDNDEYELIQVWFKPYNIPSSASDAEGAENCSSTVMTTSVTCEEEDTSYYFVLYARTKNGIEVTSDPYEATSESVEAIWLFKMDTDEDGRDIIHYDESKQFTYNPSNLYWPFTINTYTGVDGQLYSMDEIEPRRSGSRDYAIIDKCLEIRADNSDKDAIVWAFDDTFGNLYGEEGDWIINARIQADNINMLKGLVIAIAGIDELWESRYPVMYINLGNLDPITNLWHYRKKIFPENLQTNTWYNLKIKIIVIDGGIDRVEIYLNGTLIKYFNNNIYSNLGGLGFDYTNTSGLLPNYVEYGSSGYVDYYVSRFFNWYESSGYYYRVRNYYLNSVSLFYDQTSTGQSSVTGTIKVKDFYIKISKAKRYKILRNDYYFKPDFYSDGRDSIRGDESDLSYVWYDTSASYDIDGWSKEESSVQPRQVYSGELYENHAGSHHEYSSYTNYNDSQLTDDVSCSNGVLTISDPLHYPVIEYPISGTYPYIDLAWQFGEKKMKYVMKDSDYVWLHIEMKRPESLAYDPDYSYGGHHYGTEIFFNNFNITVSCASVEDGLPPESEILWSYPLHGYNGYHWFEEIRTDETHFSTEWHSYDIVYIMDYVYREKHYRCTTDHVKFYRDNVLIEEWHDGYTVTVPGRKSDDGINPYNSSAIVLYTCKGYQFRNFYIKPADTEPLVTN